MKRFEFREGQLWVYYRTKNEPTECYLLLGLTRKYSKFSFAAYCWDVIFIDERGDHRLYDVRMDDLVLYAGLKKLC